MVGYSGAIVGAVSNLAEVCNPFVPSLNGPTGCPAQRLADAGKRIGFQGDSCTLSIRGLDKSDLDVMLGGRIVGVADYFSRDAIAVFLGQ